MNIKIGIIIVNYNGLKDTLDCLKSIFSQTFKNYDIYVVDNNSKDNIDKLKEYNIELIQLRKNVGFSAANNVGARKAISNNCNYLLFLNNDTILDKNCIENLVTNISENCVLSPIMFYFYNKNEIWYSGGHFNSYGIPIHNTTTDESYNDFITGCCFLISSDLFLNVGFWDERYFLYWEDADYSKRLDNKGVSIKVIDSAILYHKVSKTTGGSRSPLMRYYQIRNKLLFLHDYSFGIRSKIRLYLTLLYNIVKPKYFIYVLFAYIDFKCNLFGKTNRFNY